ncbi:DUF2812 domain-containing protein [Paenibacillus donghaensis]|uniref:DUF2812 domain-containing protein n=1 Tax=Paenibacillus donghaensis TaxID=414771 RepID=UPI0018840815|nr:DUF2812 domain-containing protein [Paenibacillus donghaensis]MBE9914673.1 DUF2812 domain-containing protein [Paenibacillus donghaensis]
MKKFKFFTDFDREERWLNEMARAGYVLAGKTFAYEFAEVQPQEANYRMDYRNFKTAQDFEDYRALFEDSGWKHIAGTKRSGYQYFKQISGQADGDIFSDADSKAGRYRRIADMWSSLACCYIPLFMVFMLNGTVNMTAVMNPKVLYYTPGLWERSGVDFWKAFLFETPFALLRGFSWMVIPLMILVYFVFWAKAKRHYLETKQSH